MSWFRRNTKRIDKLAAELKEAEWRRERDGEQEKFDAELKAAREAVAAEHVAKYRKIPGALSTVECPKCLSGNLDRDFVAAVSLAARSVYENVMYTYSGAMWAPLRQLRPCLVQSESVELLRLTCVNCQCDLGWEKPADAQG